MTKRGRNQKGSMFVLIVCLAVAIFIPLLVTIGKMSPYFVYRGRSENVVEAAALLAANDLSRIVVNDPDFGYISLSNQAATGAATKAKDGEPLPVTSINTLIGTIRQNAIIAEELRNDAMKMLVDKDVVSLKRASLNLNQQLGDALSNRGSAADMDGSPVNPRLDVQNFLAQNLPDNVQVESLKMTLGWLDGGSDTIIDVPQPLRYARVFGTQMDDGKYEAFTNVPVGKNSFSFAGAGTQAHLVSSRKFKNADDNHSCSIIKIECVLASKNDPGTKTVCIACSQPSSKSETVSRGAMTLRITGRPVPGMLSWGDFLANGSFSDNKITTYHVVDGDFPYEPSSKMRVSANDPHSDTSQQFAAHLYYWLRNGHLQARIDSVLSMISEPFLADQNQVYTYQFENDGKISRKVADGSDFARPVTADGQFAVMADTKLKSGDGAIVFFRDNVSTLGTNSGKHAGQALAGFPLTNSQGADHAQIAKDFSDRDSHPDGLAVDIEIGGTGDDSARRDVISMKERTANRRI
ncbi:MAG: hypothetical protein K2X27_28670 [Candidatus Obscuribacterales bacterium]|nr:hypothetical protein [Candidatus Obscuribacterales bacterium]